VSLLTDQRAADPNAPAPVDPMAPNERR
jgi:hypothetical protein